MQNASSHLYNCTKVNKICSSLELPMYQIKEKYIMKIKQPTKNIAISLILIQQKLF